MNNCNRNIFLGDIHGDYDVIRKFIKNYDITNANIIQLGDFGVGFGTFTENKKQLDYYNKIFVKRNVHIWVVRGNHDNKLYFNNDLFKCSNIHLMPDYSVQKLNNQNILFIGGGISIDRTFRKLNTNYWSDEIFILDEEKLKSLENIDIVATHIAPIYAHPSNIEGYSPLVERIIDKSGDFKLRVELKEERLLVNRVFEILSEKNDIKYHFYGHYHDSNISTHNNIQHILLNVNEFYELNDNSC